jgi:hypothetical protein
MANALLSNKPKSKAAPAAKLAVSRTQLVEGATKLAQVVLSHVVEAHDFQDAYSLILQAVPASRRQQLLRYMREGLDEVTKAELASAATSSPGSADEACVSTSDFMHGLEVQEAVQRAGEVNEGLLIPAAKLAARLKMTPQGLHHALKAKRIFSLPGPSGEQVYPAFFADPRQDRKMLEKVSKSLGDLPGAAKWDFFMSPRISLGKRTPLEALAKGKFEAVMAAANVFAEE